MPSRAIKIFKREWPVPEWIPRILGAGLAALIIVSGQPPAYGQAPQYTPLPQSGAPAHAGAAPQATPAPAAEPPANAVPSVEQTASATLPQDLTPLGMFMSADIIVKAVMVGLIFASVLTWTIWLAKSLELWGARRRLRRAQRTLSAAQSFADAAPAARAATLARASPSTCRPSACRSSRWARS